MVDPLPRNYWNRSLKPKTKRGLKKHFNFFFNVVLKIELRGITIIPVGGKPWYKVFMVWYTGTDAAYQYSGEKCWKYLKQTTFCIIW